MACDDFAESFRALTGVTPFPWQKELYRRFCKGAFPAQCCLPTGLGKTSIVVIWLHALAEWPAAIPRRLVYVVNRRTVVDQTTAEVERLRRRLSGEASDLARKLSGLAALPTDCPLAISTLRGQFADNREWAEDPARPAVIIGTVDMIGSGLLFSRYTAGFRTRPFHAGLLAQDVLLVHDEAHLEPAFQVLLDSLVGEQRKRRDLRPFRVMELSATTRSEPDVARSLTLSQADQENAFVCKRITAVKRLSLVPLDEKDKEETRLVELALRHRDLGRAILVFSRSVGTATKIADQLQKEGFPVATLTGTMRGKERDELVSANAVFQRFLPDSCRVESAPPPHEGAVFLVATSAGEVGVNLSADDLVCDLSTYESMAQRLGRVNRFGERDDTTLTVAHPREFPHSTKIAEAEARFVSAKTDRDRQKARDSVAELRRKSAPDIARERTLTLLRQLDGDASPAALEKLSAFDRVAAFSPAPAIRVATEIQFDAWALTSIREPIAARPPVAPYLHGEQEWEPPETHVAWREDPDVVCGALLAAYPPEDLLDDFPLKPHELLRDTTKRVVETLGGLVQGLRKDTEENPEDLPAAWLVRESGTVELLRLGHFAAKERKEALEALLADATIILPASVGGISLQGMLSSDRAGDAADTDVSAVSAPGGQWSRIRIWCSAPDVPPQYAAHRLLRVIDTWRGREDISEDDEKVAANCRYWLWLEARTGMLPNSSTNRAPTLAEHCQKAEGLATAFAERLLPPATAGEPDLRRCVVLAARLHDQGKNRRRWQFGIGNDGYDPTHPDTILAKAGCGMRPRLVAEDYRHEFGSLVDALNDASFVTLSEDEKDIVLHLIAAHHGRARPHFPAAEITDSSTSLDTALALATEVPRRFSRLQQRFGRWGLAWLESLLRAADYAASKGATP